MENYLQKTLSLLYEGEISPETAYNKLKNFEDLGYVKIDHHRAKRKGFPEVIYGEGKTAEQIISIFKRLIEFNKIILATRVTENKAVKAIREIPELQYDEISRILYYSLGPFESKSKGTIGILCAGTSDLKVAEEAALTALAMGNKIIRFYDIGVAGIHRLFHHLDEIKKCRVLIIIAGMEGALPSVVGGLTDQPIIAVPTDIGYGTNLEGLTPLLAMLTSCASGVSVVNINNGFGAAYSASLINQIGEKE